MKVSSLLCTFRYNTISFLILERTDSEKESGQIQQDDTNIGRSCFL